MKRIPPTFFEEIFHIVTFS